MFEIQVGQCGNQLGQSFWSALAGQKSQGGFGSEDYEFFRYDSKNKKQARCLLIDTEPKVVRSVIIAY